MFFPKLEERLNEEVQHPLFGYKTTYRRCIELQARLLARLSYGRNRGVSALAHQIGGTMRKKRVHTSQTKCYVVAYDIPDNRRQTKVHQILLGFGKWTQYSLFESFLSKRDMILFQAKLAEYLSEKQDRVRFYPLCSACIAKVQTIGGPPPEEDLLFIFSSRLRGTQ